MSHRTLKRLFIASALLIAFPIVAAASTSRLAGMGTQGDYTKDYTNIFGYPSCISQVGNLVYGELGQATDYDQNYSEYFQTEDRSVGAVLGNLFDGKFGTFGFHLREYSPALGAGFQPQVGYDAYLDEYLLGTGFETYYGYNQPLDPNSPSQTGYTPYFNGYGTEAFDLMWGKKFDKMSLGLRLNRSNTKSTAEGDPPSTTVEGTPGDRNIMGLGVGIGFENSDKLSTELGILYQSRTFKNDNGTTVTENDGGGAYLVSARAMWQWKPDVLVVPVIRLYSFDLSTTSTTGGTSTKFDATLSGWQAGFAGNWTLNQKDLFVAGLTFAGNTMDDKTDKEKVTESIMPTMFASLETKVNPWLTLRFGGRKGVFYTVKDEFPGETARETTKDSYSPFQFFLGTGVKLGTLQFDATLAQDFFHNPATYITSPNNNYTPLFPKVTATYSF